MKHAENLAGLRLKTFVVVRRDESQDRGSSSAHWLLVCERCGFERVRAAPSIKIGRCSRCPCVAERMKTLRDKIRNYRQSILHAEELLRVRRPELEEMELERAELAATDDYR